MRKDYIETLNRIKTDRSALLPAIICVLLLIVIIYSLYVRVRMYMLGISLWNDEALLVEFIVNRSFGEMLLLPQTTPRTEPFLFLMTVKALSELFGISEAVLRVYSFISLVLLLIAQGLLLRKVFKVRIVWTLFSVAVSSTLLYYMQHSAELKPYMGDAAFVLIALLGYHAYRKGFFGQGIRGPLLLALLFSVCMLFSSPSAFAAGAVFIVEFLAKCLRKDRPGLLKAVIGGAAFLAAFSLNYVFWLRTIATSDNMAWFWISRNFEFKLTGEALAHNIFLIQDLLEPVWHAAVLVVPLAIAGLLVSLAKRNIHTVVIGVFFILLVVAAEIGKYPIQNRLWLFLYAIIFIYVFIFIDFLRVRLDDAKAAKAVQTVIALALACLMLVPNLSFPAYGRGEEWTLAPGNQANPIIEYIEENIQDGEVLYAFFTTDTINTVLRYKIGYDNFRIGNVSSDNVIYGTEDYDGDIELIAETGGAYIFFYHAYFPLSQDKYKRKMVGRLQERGYMEQILNVYHTYLYWFTDDIARVRASATLDVFDVSIEDSSLHGIAHIENTGTAILAPERVEGHPDPEDGPDWDDYGRLLVVLYKAEGRIPSAGIEDGFVLGEIPHVVPPGGSAEILIGYEGLEPGEYWIELVSYGAYSFSELGVAPIPVVR